jgi:phage terminase large subunit-like protein
MAISPPWAKPEYQPTYRRLVWPNGAIATTYSAEEPDQLRGPQHDAAWADELAAWKYADAWDQLQFGLRLGSDPRCVVTTTPRPTPIIRGLISSPSTTTTRGSTYENKTNLAPAFIEQVLAKYEGTRLGRQELHAEILDDSPRALWKRAGLDALRVTELPRMKRIVVAVDPSVSSQSETAATGIVVCGLGEDGHGYAIEDGSLESPTPDEWARQVVALYNKHEADRVIAEINNGGDLVEANVRTVSPRIPYKSVRATRGKDIRADPIAGLAEQLKIHHFGFLPLLEDELCTWEPGGSSPNRLDAYVWGFTELMMGAPPIPNAYGVARSHRSGMPRARD